MRGQLARRHTDTVDGRHMGVEDNVAQSRQTAHRSLGEEFFEGQHDAYRVTIRNPGWSPTTVICPLQGKVSSTLITSPVRNCLVSPSVVVIENAPSTTVTKLCRRSRMV